MAKSINNWKEELATLDNEIKTVIDVGVMEGTFAIYDRYPDAQLVLIDPLKESKSLVSAKIKNRPFMFYNCAVGKEKDTVTINIDSKMRQSSVLKRTNIVHTEVVSQRQIDVKLLDELEFDRSKSPYLLKIDTEGFELNVLNGASKTIQNCKYIICETSVKKRFYDSYSFEDLILFFRDSGFVLRGVLNAPQGLRCLDLLFEKVIV